MAKAKLTYFRGRGFAEVFRLAFALVEEVLEEEYFNVHEDFKTLLEDGKSLMFQQVPKLEIDDIILNESNAIAMYVARKYNLLGKNRQEEGRILNLYFGARSYLQCGSLTWAFQDTPEAKEKMKKESIEKSNNRYLPAFEKALKENGTGFLVGDTPTIADCALYDVLTNHTEAEVFKSLVLLDDKPHCQAFMKKFSELPGIKNYLNSSQRIGTPDLAFAESAKEILWPKKS